MKRLISQLAVRMVEESAKNPRKGTAGLVRLPRLLLWVGAVCGGIFMIPGLLVPLQTGEWTMAVFFLCFAALSFSLVIGYINCRVFYNESEFTVKYFLGYRRTFAYHQIEAMRGSNRDIKLIVAGHAVRIDELAVGRREFLDLARKQYRISHGGKAIPKIEKDKWDLFNGHVDNPGQFLFAYLLIALFIPGMLLFGFFTVKPTPLEELNMVTGPVTRATVDESDLVLNVRGIEMEIWRYRRALPDADAFTEGYRRGETFTFGYRTVTDEGKFVGYCVEYILDSRGITHMTPRDAWEQRFFTASVALVAVEGIWLIFCGLSIYVGRNPHKFSKRIVSWFFRDGYVH